MKGVQKQLMIILNAQLFALLTILKMIAKRYVWKDILKDFIFKIKRIDFDQMFSSIVIYTQVYESINYQV